jgi:hypothetical protein
MINETKMFTCKICGETKPLEGFYTNSKVDKNKPYQLVCRICYQAIRKARESGNPLNIKPTIPRGDKRIKSVNREPAKLTCSISDFHEFLGDNIKNYIPYLTVGERRKLNHICQKCGREVTQLDSAHVHGRERPQVIEDIIKKYTIDDKKQIIQVDLHKVIDEIIEANRPIKNNFRFLCKECHRKYDNYLFHLDCCEKKNLSLKMENGI